MRLNPIAVLKEHETGVAPESGIDPLPLPLGQHLCGAHVGGVH